MNAYVYIRENVSEAELLAQLAEEATELAHAALKMRRTLDDTNPTPITYYEARTNLNEEIADVRLLISVLGFDNDHMGRLYIQGNKLARWVDRLKKAKKKEKTNND